MELEDARIGTRVRACLDYLFPTGEQSCSGATSWRRQRSRISSRAAVGLLVAAGNNQTLARRPQ